jgi:hypothetical protein
MDVSGSVSVEEKTIFLMSASASVPGSPSAANPDMSRNVLAPISTVQSASGEAPSQAR